MGVCVCCNYLTATDSYPVRTVLIFINLIPISDVERPLTMDQTLIQAPPPAGRDNPGWNETAGMTWPNVSTTTAWYYNDGSYQNLYGRWVTPPDTTGPTKLVSYPPGGFTW